MNKLKNFFIGELYTLKASVTKVEYALWWILRLLQTYALISLIIRDPENGNILLLSLNLLATFTVTLARIIIPWRSLIKKLSFRTQSWLNIMIFFGSFLAQGMEWNSKITSWDKILHLISGFLILLLGNELVDMFMRKNDCISPLMRTFTATGFSYLAITIWEIFEFFVDYYWPGSYNQAYNISPDRDPWFAAIFGQGACNENQWAVFDTNVDMFCAVIGTIPAIIVLYLYLSKKEKQRKSTEEKVAALN